MAEWEVRDQQQWEREYRQRLGDAEFERRKKLANDKADELMKGGKDGFAEGVFMRTQFESLVMKLDADQVARMETFPARRWANFIYRLAGV